MPAGGEAEARRFFGDLLGLAELSKPAALRDRGGCWFALGDRQLHLGVEEPFRPAEKAHVALASDDLNGVRGRLKAAGCVIPSGRAGGRAGAVLHPGPVRKSTGVHRGERPLSHNSFGHLFRVTTWGESHGSAIGAVVDGCPPGLRLSEKDIQPFLDRRRPGQSRFTTQRREPDQVADPVGHL